MLESTSNVVPMSTYASGAVHLNVVTAALQEGLSVDTANRMANAVLMNLVKAGYVVRQSIEIINVHPRADWVKCIRKPDDTTWCGKMPSPFEWCFGNLDHAAINAALGGRLVACTDCVRHASHVLNGVYEKTGSGDVLNDEHPDENRAH